LIRKATLNDIPSMLEAGRDLFLKSNMACCGWNGVIARRTFKNAIQDHDSVVFIAMKDGKITGILIGTVDTMPFSAARCATDIAFGAVSGGGQLLSAFLKWCRAKKVRRIDMGITQEGERTGVLYERKGLVRSGGMYYLNLEAESVTKAA
jgi:hypothetical protein